jgi:predicted N-acyltransferase
VPVPTWSAHAIADAEFARAIAAFCARERVDVAHALHELETASPFRNPESGNERRE